MLTFLLKRTLYALISLLLITLIVFSLSHLSGNPLDALLPDDATPEQIERVTRNLGLDQPIALQYLTFLQNAAVGDFGESVNRHAKLTHFGGL
ncbi:MAG: hypothetical protein EA386_14575 [Rhodobacteraceae bacterium]|nr:MAG: hypothetical protein EA386_14575 [Paracoccaceae bacterium]